MHVVITYNMFWYALNQKKRVCMWVSVLCMSMLYVSTVCVPIIAFHNTTKYCEFLFSGVICMDFRDHLSYVNSAVSVDTPCL